MTREDFDNIQNGQKVRFVKWDRQEPIDILTIKEGDILVRSKDWLDCGICVKFVKEDLSDYHWFYADEIELIKEDE